MVFKLECGLGSNASTVRHNSEYLPFVKVPTASLPSGADIHQFHAFLDKVQGRQRYILNVRVHANEGKVILEENQSAVVPAPTLTIIDEQLHAMEKGGLEVVVYDPISKAQDACIIKPR